MMVSPFRYTINGIIIGMLFVILSRDYVVISKRKYETLKRKAED